MSNDGIVKENAISDCQETFQLCPKFEKHLNFREEMNGLIIDVLLEGAQRFKHLVHSVPKCSDRVS